MVYESRRSFGDRDGTERVESGGPPGQRTAKWKELEKVRESLEHEDD